MATQIVYVANTNNLLLTGLKSDIENLFFNAALVMVIIKDKGGNVVMAQSQMDYITASDGDYLLGVPAATNFKASSTYTAIIDADASDTNVERIGHWELPLSAKTRTS